MPRKAISISPELFYNLAPISNEIEYFSLRTHKSQLRYTNEDLQEFRAILEIKLEAATAEHEALKAAVERLRCGGLSNTSFTFKLSEDAWDVYTRQQITEMAHKREHYIEQLKAAINRIENRTYGICKISGKLISKERLRLVPHTTMSLDNDLEITRMN